MSEINFFCDPLSDHILQERDETGAVTAEYTTEPGLYGRIISQNRNGVESQFHFDAHGSTLAVTDDTQHVTDAQAYTAFGQATEGSGNSLYPYRFIGRLGYYYVQDSEYCYKVRRRDYCSSIIRWITVDPIGAYPLECNRYRYAQNRPSLSADPSGQKDHLLSLFLNDGSSDCTTKQCCCCAGPNPTYTYKPLQSTNPEAELNPFWGHTITFTARLDFHELLRDKGNERGCRLEWWECSTSRGSLGQLPNAWNAIHTFEQFKDVDTNWHSYYDGTMEVPCPGYTSLFIKDTPMLPFPKSRVVKFAVRVLNAPGCKCDPNFETWTLFTQVLETEPGAKYDPFVDKFTGVKSWKVISGIDDNSEPKNCTYDKLVALADK